MQLVTGIFLLFCVITHGADLPSNFKICKQNDPNLEECFAEASKQAINLMAPGLKSLRLLPIDPLSVDSVSIGEGGGAVSLKQEYRNIKLYGLSKGLEVSDYKVDLPNLVFKSMSFNPQVDFVADYTVDGKVLVLPIRGHGRSNITMLNLKTQNTFYGEKFEKDGETYMRITKYNVKFNPEKVLLKFENLFGGDKFLSNQMNTFLNENADLLFKELQASYEETFGLVFAQMANEIFTRVPFNKILPES
ncbi:protein takeout-like isoform X2 [Diachasma alloeum]|uniref:protein takeout-like isoform X2 n=1 Tax=Diachasma alloeum TaxID=454923 RepID=UPI0007382A94|nr:protein takeout-like isoform X2 [Diachasma alloeum]